MKLEPKCSGKDCCKQIKRFFFLSWRWNQNKCSGKFFEEKIFRLTQILKLQPKRPGKDACNQKRNLSFSVLFWLNDLIMIEKMGRMDYSAVYLIFNNNIYANSLSLVSYICLIGQKHTEKWPKPRVVCQHFQNFGKHPIILE